MSRQEVLRPADLRASLGSNGTSPPSDRRRAVATGESLLLLLILLDPVPFLLATKDRHHRRHRDRLKYLDWNEISLPSRRRRRQLEEALVPVAVLLSVPERFR
jgi:hypothetical protein